MASVHIHAALGESSDAVEQECPRREVEDITEEDAMREGVRAESVSTQPGIYSYRAPFVGLWDSINAERGFGWDANPWVWVVAFERVSP